MTASEVEIMLARIFHTDCDEEAAKPDRARRAMESDDGCVCTHCLRKTSSSTQHPSDFPASVVDQYEISGLVMHSFLLNVLFCVGVI